MVATDFYPVWDISYQKPNFMVQILWLCRFDKVPTFNIRPAGTNLQIRPIVLQENNQMPIFSHTRARISDATTKSGHPKITSILLWGVINFLPSGWLPILVKWFWEVHVNLCQDKVEVHIRYRGGETKRAVANKGGKTFDQRPFFDF